MTSGKGEQKKREIYTVSIASESSKMKVDVLRDLLLKRRAHERQIDLI